MEIFIRLCINLVCAVACGELYGVACSVVCGMWSRMDVLRYGSSVFCGMGLHAIVLE
jgi:hypothetical protein